MTKNFFSSVGAPHFQICSGAIARAMLQAEGVHIAVICLIVFEALFFCFRKLALFHLRYVQAYETGNRYHLLHSVALLGVPLTRKPRLVLH